MDPAAPSSTCLPLQAKALPVPMDGNVLEERWHELVSSHFGALEESIMAMLTANEVVSEALHGDLRWAISRTEFDELVKREIDDSLLNGSRWTLRLRESAA